MSLVRGGGSIVVKVNEDTSPYFHPGKGLRQGDPLSPLLFNLVVDVFTRMLNKASDKGYVTGLMSSMNSAGVVSL
jgi:hypothetical protein